MCGRSRTGYVSHLLEVLLFVVMATKEDRGLRKSWGEAHPATEAKLPPPRHCRTHHNTQTAAGDGVMAKRKLERRMCW